MFPPIVSAAQKRAVESFYGSHRFRALLRPEPRDLDARSQVLVWGPWSVARTLVRGLTHVAPERLARTAPHAEAAGSGSSLQGMTSVTAGKHLAVVTSQTPSVDVKGYALLLAVVPASLWSACGALLGETARQASSRRALAGVTPDDLDAVLRRFRADSPGAPVRIVVQETERLPYGAKRVRALMARREDTAIAAHLSGAPPTMRLCGEDGEEAGWDDSVDLLQLKYDMLLHAIAGGRELGV